MFDQLNQRFSKILKSIRGHGKITDKNIEETLRDIRRALLEADVNFLVAKSFIARVKEKAKGREVFDTISPGQQFIKIILDELNVVLGEKDNEITFDSSSKTIILLVGLQGSGKTTTAAKLARFLKIKLHKNPILIAADLQRPAAIDQLEILGRQINVPVFSKKSKDVIGVVKEGISKSLDHDVVIIDTAGRLHIDDELMKELKDVCKLASPHEILYIADGMTGQDAVNSAKSFSELIDITGVVLTKMEGDSRGGAAISIREVTSKPIKFMGLGENLEALEVFHPERLAKRILGMGDVISLVEKAQETFDYENEEKLKKKIVNSRLTLSDFQDQLKQLQKMGPISQIIEMLPGASKLGKLNMNDQQLKWVDAIINSMTPYERENPNFINGSRRKRIAKGSGRSVQEVNQLLKQFEQMKKMMKKMGSKGIKNFSLFS
mgnify:FL=1